MPRSDDRLNAALLRPPKPPAVLPPRTPKKLTDGKRPTSPFDAARLRPPHPPPVPPKTPPKTPPKDMHKLTPLPPRLSGRPAASSRTAFPVHLSLNLLPPASANTESGRSLCTQISMIYISTPHHSDIIDHLLLLAETGFGLDLSERSKWRYNLLARCQDYNGCVSAENAEFVVSASRQGGWTWTLMLVEIERSARGVWESVETYSVPRVSKLDAGFFDQRAVVGSEREI